MIKREFFDRDTLEVAKDLLGKIIIRKDNNIIYKARIVETEAYMGIEDRACQTFGNKKTNRNKIMYEDAGTIYIYQTYGIHYLMNFITRDNNHPEGVLIRAIEPLSEIDNFSLNRFGLKYENLSPYQKKNLTNGPGKITKALSIDKKLNGKNLFTENFYIEDDLKDFQIITDKRIGIDYAKEAKDYPYRFYIKDNHYVSKVKKDKI